MSLRIIESSFQHRAICYLRSSPSPAHSEFFVLRFPEGRTHLLIVRLPVGVKEVVKHRTTRSNNQTIFPVHQSCWWTGRARASPSPFRPPSWTCCEWRTRGTVAYEGYGRISITVELDSTVTVAVSAVAMRVANTKYASLFWIRYCYFWMKGTVDMGLL